MASFSHGCCWKGTVWNHLCLIFLKIRISQVYFTIAAEYFRGVFFIASNLSQGKAPSMFISTSILFCMQLN